MALPAPRHQLSVENVFVGPPGRPLPVIQDVSFKLASGQALGVIGPSAAGKSTLVGALTGVWAPLRGEIRLDGAALDQWPPPPISAATSAICRRTSSFSTAPSPRTSRVSTPMPRPTA